MHSIRFLIASMAVAASSAALAQPGPMGPCSAASGASAPSHGCGGPMMAPHARWGRDDTAGWAMMTPEERQQHRDRMAGFKNYDECKAYMDKHHEDMAARAKAQGKAMPAKPRHDACAPLKSAK